MISGSSRVDRRIIQWKAVGILCALAILLLVTPKSQAKTTITYLMAGGAPIQQLGLRLIDKFEKANPDIDVEVIWVPGAAKELFEKFQILVAGGSAPDVFWTHAYLMEDIVAKGLARPLDTLISGDSQFAVNSYFDAALGDYSFQGKLYGLPGEVSSMALYYNADLFEQRGMSVPDRSWTWDTLLKAALKLTDKSSNRWGLFAPSGHAQAYVMAWQNDGRLFDETRSRPTFDDRNTVEAYQWIADLMYKHRVSPPGGQVEGGLYSAFTQVKIGMFYDIPAASVWLQKAAYEWDVAPLPREKQQANRVATSGYSIYARTKHPDAAWRLVKFLAGTDAQREILSQGLNIPSIQALASSPFFLKHYAKPKNTQVFLEMLRYARSEPITSNYIAVIGAKERALLPLWRGEEPASSVMKAVNTAIQAALRQK